MSEDRMLAPGLAARLWALLATQYGPLWESQYGREPDDGQRFVLGALTAREVSAGMERIVARDGKLPPNLAEVREMCRPPDRRTPEQRALYGRMEREAPLPALEAVAASAGSTGRCWYGYWLVRGLRPWPRELDADTVDEWLDGHDLQAMDREARAMAARCGYLAEYDRAVSRD